MKHSTLQNNNNNNNNNNINVCKVHKRCPVQQVVLETVVDRACWPREGMTMPRGGIWLWGGVGRGGMGFVVQGSIVLGSCDTAPGSGAEFVGFCWL